MAISADESQVASQVAAAMSVTIEMVGERVGQFPAAESLLSCHEGSSGGNGAQVETLQTLEAEIDQLLAARAGNLSGTLSRTRAFDDFARGRLVTLLGIGLSQRQAAAALGVSHTAVQGELARRPELAEEITAARFQAQIEPLLVILRESKRSWRAASWLVNYLTRQVATREETPDEALARLRAEQVARRDQGRADEKQRKEHERKVSEREARRKIHRKQAENAVYYGRPSPKLSREFDEQQRQIKELFEKLEAEDDAAE